MQKIALFLRNWFISSIFTFLFFVLIWLAMNCVSGILGIVIMWDISVFGHIFKEVFLLNLFKDFGVGINPLILVVSWGAVVLISLLIANLWFPRDISDTINNFLNGFNKYRPRKSRPSIPDPFPSFGLNK